MSHSRFNYGTDGSVLEQSSLRVSVFSSFTQSEKEKRWPFQLLSHRWQALVGWNEQTDSTIQSEIVSHFPAAWNSTPELMFLSRNSQVLLEREREREVCVYVVLVHTVGTEKEKDGCSNRIHTDGESRRSLLIKAGLKGERRYSFGFGALRRLLLCACAAAAQGEKKKKKKRAEGRGGSERERERKRKD